MPPICGWEVNIVFVRCFECELEELQEQICKEYPNLDLQDSIIQFLTSLVRNEVRTEGAELFSTGPITVANGDTVLTGTSKSDGEIQELAAAMENGMRVTQTGICIVVNIPDPATCTLTMPMNHFLRLSGMKLPKTETPATENSDGGASDGFETVFLERMLLLEKYTGIVLEAFKASIKCS